MQRRRVEIRLFCLQRLTRRQGRTRKARYLRDKCTDHPRSLIPEDCVVEVIGLELETHHPVIEPVSDPRRERKFPMQRLARKSRLIAGRDQSGDAKGVRKAPILAQ
jgi:hypothetical protein